MTAGEAFGVICFIGIVGLLIFLCGQSVPDGAARDQVLCEDRCEQRGEKLLSVVKRECICATSRVALPGRSAP